MEALQSNPTLLAIAALASIVIGAINCFFGYRFLRLFLVIIGFVIGFYVGSSVVGGAEQSVSLFAGLIVGIILAIIFYFLYIFGFIIAGGGLGVSIATIVAQNIGLDSNTTLLVIIGGAIIGGILAIFIAKYVVMLGTAFFGAAQIVYGALIVLNPGILVQTAPEQYEIRISGTPQVIATVAWFIISLFGLFSQLRNNRRG